MKKLLIALGGVLLLSSPVMAHSKGYRYHSRGSHSHCHNHYKRGYSHCHWHSHRPGNGYHGRQYMHDRRHHGHHSHRDHYYDGDDVQIIIR